MLKRIIYHFIINPHKKRKFKSIGKNVHLEYGVAGTLDSITVGSDVYFGLNNLFLCTEDAPIVIGDHVMFGPNVTIITGDHRIDVPGKYMTETKVTEKLQENDMPVILEGDNWIGANSIILKGVKIGTGAVVAAGACVTNDVPPYTVVGGVPAKVISKRFTDKQLEKHVTLIANRNLNKND